MKLTICNYCGCHIVESTECSCLREGTAKSSVRTLMIASLMGVGLTGCDIIEPKSLYGVPDSYLDGDFDGEEEMTDCDDNDPMTFTGAAENEPVEENTVAECMTDADEDGWGSDSPSEDSPMIVPGSDCDDSNPDIHPGAEEIVGDGIDQNCNDSDED